MLDDMIVTGTGDTGFGEINKEADNKISFYDIFEMSDCICFHYLQNQRRLAQYDKINNEVCRVRGRKKQEKRGGIGISEAAKSLVQRQFTFHNECL